MRMHPITLAFADREQERRFREDHARRSVPYLRALLVFVAVATVGLSYMTGLAARFAAWHGMDRLESFAAYTPYALVASLATYAMLIGLTYWRPAWRWLRLIVTVVFLVGSTIDFNAMLTVGGDFALASAFVNVVLVYFALRLRFLTAVAVGTTAVAAYLVAYASAIDLAGQPSGEDSLAFGLSGVMLIAMNAMGAFIAYQHEALARGQFLQTDLIERQKQRLEAALNDLRETETQLIETEKQASLGRFVAGLLHEINSPLGALTSAASTIERGLDRCERLLDHPASEAERVTARRSIQAARRLLETQASSAERLTALVTDLKGFIGLDAAERQSLDVRRALDSSLRLLAGALGTRIAVERELPDQPVVVDCHPAQLNQVFLRVLQNAVDALHDGGTIRVVVRQDGDRAHVRIADDGPGLASSQIAGLFEPRLIRKGSRVRMNLGLPISKRTVEKLGGTLTLESQEGRGTSVTIDLPALPAAEALAPRGIGR